MESISVYYFWCYVYNNADGLQHTEVCSCRERMTNLIRTVNLITDAIVFAWHVCGTQRGTQRTIGNSLFEILNRSKFLPDFYCHNLQRPCEHVTLHARIQYEERVRSAKYEYLHVFAISQVAISVDFLKTQACCHSFET